MDFPKKGFRKGVLFWKIKSVRFGGFFFLWGGTLFVLILQDNQQDSVGSVSHLDTNSFG